MQHSKSALLHAIKLAGSQINLASLLEISATQLSAWLHNPKVNMPLKYGDIIEEWSDGQITKKNLFPNLRLTQSASKSASILSQIDTLLEQAATRGVGINISINLDTSDSGPLVSIPSISALN